MMRSLKLAIATVALLAATPAVAEDWIISLGGGAQVYPKFPGGEDLGLAPLVYFDFRRAGSELTVGAPDQSRGIGLLGRDSVVDFGPILALRTKREEQDAGAPIGDVDLAVELGAFVSLTPHRNLRLRAEGRRAVSGHDGWTGDLLADLVFGDRQRWIATIGPRARWGDETFHAAYFGVTPAVAAATGLPAYSAGEGFYAVGVAAGLTHMLSRDWGLYTYAGYDRLVGDAADSPIVQSLGSRHQFSAGIGLFYSFNAGSIFGD